VQVFVRSLAVVALAGALSVPIPGAGAAPGGDGTGRSQSQGGQFGTAGLGHVGTVTQSESETDLVTGVVSTYLRTDTYDNRGRETHSLEGELVDDVWQWRAENTAEYGAYGIARMVRVFDADGDGDGEAETAVDTFVYDGKGVLVAIVSDYYGTDDVVDYTDREDYTRDRQGRRLTTHVEVAGDFGFVEDTTFTYDKHGNVTSSETVTDWLDDPGSPDQRYLDTSRYSASGSFLSGVTELYVYDDNGENPVLDFRDSYEATYGKAGQIASEHVSHDEGGDGTIEGTSDYVYGYDKRGNQTSSVQTSVFEGDTVVTTMLTTYDNHDRQLTFDYEETVNGTLVYHRESADTFDTRGRFTGFTETEDADGDGVDDFAVRQVIESWDSRGRETSFHTTEEDGQGTVLVIHDVTIEWFRYYQVRTSFHDTDADGDYDTKLVRVVPLV
jgi:hypothetical protein